MGDSLPAINVDQLTHSVNTAIHGNLPPLPPLPPPPRASVSSAAGVGVEHSEGGSGRMVPVSVSGLSSVPMFSSQPVFSVSAQSPQGSGSSTLPGLSPSDSDSLIPTHHHHHHDRSVFTPTDLPVCRCPVSASTQTITTTTTTTITSTTTTAHQTVDVINTVVSPSVNGGVSLLPAAPLYPPPVSVSICSGVYPRPSLPPLPSADWQVSVTTGSGVMSLSTLVQPQGSVRSVSQPLAVSEGSAGPHAARTTPPQGVTLPTAGPMLIMFSVRLPTPETSMGQGNRPEGVMSLPGPRLSPLPPLPLLLPLLPPPQDGRLPASVVSSLPAGAASGLPLPHLPIQLSSSVSLLPVAPHTSGAAHTNSDLPLPMPLPTQPPVSGGVAPCPLPSPSPATSVIIPHSPCPPAPPTSLCTSTSEWQATACVCLPHSVADIVQGGAPLTVLSTSSFPSPRVQLGLPLTCVSSMDGPSSSRSSGVPAPPVQSGPSLMSVSAGHAALPPLVPRPSLSACGEVVLGTRQGEGVVTLVQSSPSTLAGRGVLPAVPGSRHPSSSSTLPLPGFPPFPPLLSSSPSGPQRFLLLPPLPSVPPSLPTVTSDGGLTIQTGLVSCLTPVSAPLQSAGMGQSGVPLPVSQVSLPHSCAPSGACGGGRMAWTSGLVPMLRHPPPLPSQPPHTLSSTFLLPPPPPPPSPPPLSCTEMLDSSPSSVAVNVAVCVGKGPHYQVGSAGRGRVRMCVEEPPADGSADDDTHMSPHVRQPASGVSQNQAVASAAMVSVGDDDHDMVAAMKEGDASETPPRSDVRMPGQGFLRCTGGAGGGVPVSRLGSSVCHVSHPPSSLTGVTAHCSLQPLTPTLLPTLPPALPPTLFPALPPVVSCVPPVTLTCGHGGGVAAAAVCPPSSRTLSAIPDVCHSVLPPGHVHNLSLDPGDCQSKVSTSDHPSFMGRSGRVPESRCCGCSADLQSGLVAGPHCHVCSADSSGSGGGGGGGVSSPPDKTTAAAAVVLGGQFPSKMLSAPPPPSSVGEGGDMSLSSTYMIFHDSDVAATSLLHIHPPPSCPYPSPSVELPPLHHQGTLLQCLPSGNMEGRKAAACQHHRPLVRDSVVLTEPVHGHCPSGPATFGIPQRDVGALHVTTTGAGAHQVSSTGDVAPLPSSVSSSLRMVPCQFACGHADHRVVDSAHLVREVGGKLPVESCAAGCRFPAGSAKGLAAVAQPLVSVPETAAAVVPGVQCGQFTAVVEEGEVSKAPPAVSCVPGMGCCQFPPTTDPPHLLLLPASKPSSVYCGRDLDPCQFSSGSIGGGGGGGGGRPEDQHSSMLLAPTPTPTPTPSSSTTHPTPQCQFSSSDPAPPAPPPPPPLPPPPTLSHLHLPLPLPTTSTTVIITTPTSSQSCLYPAGLSDFPFTSSSSLLPASTSTFNVASTTTTTTPTTITATSDVPPAPHYAPSLTPTATTTPSLSVDPSSQTAAVLPAVGYSPPGLSNHGLSPHLFSPLGLGVLEPPPPLPPSSSSSSSSSSSYSTSTELTRGVQGVRCGGEVDEGTAGVVGLSAVSTSVLDMLLLKADVPSIHRGSGDRTTLTSLPEVTDMAHTADTQDGGHSAHRTMQRPMDTTTGPRGQQGAPHVGPTCAAGSGIPDDLLVPSASCRQPVPVFNGQFCLECGKVCGEVCVHGVPSFSQVRDNLVLSRARATLPDCLYLAQSSVLGHCNSTGVFAKRALSMQTEFGPLQGKVLPPGESMEKTCFGQWKIFYEEGVRTLDVSDENSSNWLMFVKPARSMLERNLLAFQRGHDLLFLTTKDIQPDLELRFWFAPDYGRMILDTSRPAPTSCPSCGQCGQVFLHLWQVRAHSRQAHPHLPSKTWACPVCGLTFLSAGRLREHGRSQHRHLQAHTCTTCGKTFADARNLKAHRNIHTGLRRFGCEVCGKHFTQKAHLQSHQATHTKVKAVQCRFCSKRFARPSDMRQHELTHTQEKALRCEQCSKVFHKPKLLRRHMRTVHDNERNYMCERCSKTFHTKYKLTRHGVSCRKA
ncbi:uncharacterized protein LOC143282839 [Babylonia areolata]|uniref:uncharacterized protein LOC143282839 n=1 Tax=Babylonia areolata TaxID=304850 RepID=UPI003FD05206